MQNRGADTHSIFRIPLSEVPAGHQVGYFAMGCYWGAEKLFWTTPGVSNTAVGFMGGSTENPSYAETCTGKTGHTETVQVVFDPEKISYAQLVQLFFENHDPTQGDRQGNDIGSQYRSAIFTTSEDQSRTAHALLADYQQALSAAGYGAITTTIEPAEQFYYAELFHQQYLSKNPNGYCPVHATGVCLS
ncbi:MAG: peptide-methionine (S)-S-oxide reductase [Propionibacterium sp.]|nr:MAG: peptide-methionine (S)-S-oxide reductase [Propionibacterium sp.]